MRNKKIEIEETSQLQSCEKDFLSHLDDLKRVILKVAFSMLAGMILCFSFAKPLFRVLLNPFSHFVASLSAGSTFHAFILKTLSPYEALSISMKISLICGIVLVSPYILLVLWDYLAPALHPKEQKYGLITIWVFPLLFLLGVVFCYFFVFPLGLKFMWDYTFYLGIQPAWTISYYMNFILGFLVAFGLSFQLPIVIVLLTKLGLITPAFLVSKRKYAIIVIFIIAALLTPADVCSQWLLGIPMVFLYEISIYLSKWLS